METGPMKRPRKAETIANRRVFMMGSGKPVQPKRSEHFCRSIVVACMDGAFVEHQGDNDFCSDCAEGVKKSFFALGFAACLDAMARGTVALDAEPVAVVNQAYSDLGNVTNKPNQITDIMKEFD